METSKQQNPNSPIAAARSNLFLGEISFVETFSFYLNVNA